VTIILNGDPHVVQDCASISALLETLNIDARRVAVEQNLVIVKRDAYGATPVADGDRIEVVNFVGGG
jgi:thiamine biosynthesis protein ThiS